MKKRILVTILLFSLSFGYAQKALWQKTTQGTVKDKEKMDRIAMPVAYSLFGLDYTALKQSLAIAPMRGAERSNVIISFPGADGKLEDYIVYEAPVMQAGLSARHPELRSYIGRGIKSPTTTIRFSTTIFGLHAMVLSSNGTFYIDPYTKDANTYIAYRKADLFESREFSCELLDTDDAAHRFGQAQRAVASNDGVLRTYRLAMASTVQYSTYHINAAGVRNGTDAQKKAAVLAAMVVSMTRINGVYEREVAVTMQLVDNNEDIIFIVDNGFSNNNAGALIEQSQTVIDGNIGADNYDIGHTVSTGGGGLAMLGSVCSDIKAKGITGSPAPVGDPYDIDYVAHEMGHQFGGNHIFNGTDGSCSGNYNNSTSVEPGSGTTIMGYAGICGEANVQANSDAYFNAVSLAEIFNVITNTNCAQISTINNNAPVVPALSGRTIPKGTAFILKGTNATDANGDALSYNWEQIDGVTNNSAHANLPTSFATQGPNYRSKAPSDAKNRYMPELADVLESNLYPTWEITPDVGRTMRFAYTVRDNNVLGGQTARRDMTVTVNNVAGPFIVTSQDQSDIVWVGGEEQTVTWDVAGTTANGINTSMVNILLSTNGGQSFDTVLLANTPNDGSETFTVPTNVVAPNCRIMVEAVGNIYYAVNSTDFSLGYLIDCATYTGAGSIAIPDNNAAFTTSNATVAGGTAISSVKVSLSATHTYTADLIFKVKSPAGTEVMLWNRQCPNRSGINVVYDDGGSNLVCGSPTRGTYRPVGNLSDFADENPTGTWQLAFSDNEGGDTGRLTAWSLEICSYTLIPASTAAFGLKDFKLYPNPNKGNFTIAFASASQNPITIGVYDMRGREVYNDSYTNTGLFSSNVNLGNMQQGVYLVTVQDGNRKETRKIVIE